MPCIWRRKSKEKEKEKHLVTRSCEIAGNITELGAETAD